MNKKQIILAAGVLLIFLGYAVYHKANSDKTASVNPGTEQTGTSASLESTNPNGTNTAEMGEDDEKVSVPDATLKVSVSGGSSTGTKATSGPFKDGAYTGEKVDAFYGPMQVKAIISGGKITDVQFLAYPDAPGTTLRKSQEDMPVLKASAIASQSSKVDAISGSTQTKEGFELSLASALAKAK